MFSGNIEMKHLVKICYQCNSSASYIHWKHQNIETDQTAIEILNLEKTYQVKYNLLDPIVFDPVKICYSSKIKSGRTAAHLVQYTLSNMKIY